MAGVTRSGPPQDWTAEVIADASVRGLSPQGWAERAVALYHAHGADRLVAEVNQGGDMVATLIRQVDPMVSFRAVHAPARQGGARRAGGGALRAGADPARRGLPRARGADAGDDDRRAISGAGSPDRVDALVWAITELMIEPAAKLVPNVRRL